MPDIDEHRKGEVRKRFALRVLERREMMNPAPPLTLSTHDARRLESLLHTLPPGPAVSRLEEELARGQLVEPADMPPHIVTMNSRVRCVEELTERVHELQLVFPRDADAASGRISVLAPVGSALLGLGVGDSIEWPVPGGRNLRLRVTEVVWQPEANGQVE